MCAGKDNQGALCNRWEFALKFDFVIHKRWFTMQEAVGKYMEEMDGVISLLSFDLGRGSSNTGV